MPAIYVNTFANSFFFGADDASTGLLWWQRFFVEPITHVHTFPFVPIIGFFYIAARGILECEQFVKYPM
jgi:hypothetical protein